MKRARLSLLVLAGACLLAMGACLLCVRTAQAAGTPYVIGAVFDVTGPGSPLGTPEQDTVKMLVKQINDHGGIKGHPLQVIFADNGSDEAKSVMAMKKLIESDKVLAIIGTSQTGTTLAGAETVASAKIPLISCAAGVKIVDPVQPYIFKTAQSDVHAVAKVLDYCKAKKLRKVAIITVSNAFGDSGKQQLKKQTPGQGINIIAEESFGTNDPDMTAQLMRIRNSRPDAVICWGTNPGPAIVAKNMVKLGMKMPLLMSHGIANKKFIELAGDAADGVIFPSGKLLVADTLPNADPQKFVLLDYTKDFQKEYGRTADTFGGHAFDALNLVVQALRKVGPDRDKIRAELERSHFVGISGVFDFSAQDHNGLDKDAFVMVKIDNGAWKRER